MAPTEADAEWVRDAYGVFNERFQQLKTNDLSGFEEYCTDDVVMVPVDGWPVSGRFEGYEGYGRWMYEVFSGTAENRYEHIETTIVGDYVVATMMSRGRADDDPTWMEAPVGVVHQLRDGRIARVWVYLGHQRALEAAATGPPE